MVEQESAKKQAEQHHQAADEVRDAEVTEHHADEQAHRGGSHVEQDQEHDEGEELAPCGHEAGHRVDNSAKDHGRKQAQWDNIEEHLTRKIADGCVVAFGALAGEEQALRREHSQRGKRAEAEESEHEEEYTKTVLETGYVVGQTIEESSDQDCQQDRDGVVR